MTQLFDFLCYLIQIHHFPWEKEFSYWFIHVSLLHLYDPHTYVLPFWDIGQLC